MTRNLFRCFRPQNPKDRKSFLHKCELNFSFISKSKSNHLINASYDYYHYFQYYQNTHCIYSYIIKRDLNFREPERCFKPLPTQLPANTCPGKAAANGSSTCVLPPMWMWEIHAPDSSLVQPGCCRPRGSEPADSRSLFLFQIK